MKPSRRVRILAERGVLALGGPARTRVVLTLAGALAVDGADKGAVSAMAPQLARTFGLGYVQIGLLASVTALSGAALTVPVGLLTDRVRRTRMLAISVALWSVAMLMAGASTSYVWLLTSRAALGAVSATAGPTVASLVGDYFPARDRARMYGLILAGELAGTGIGFALSGLIGSFLTWRFAFWWLVVPGAVLAWFIHRLAEPARGGRSRLESGQDHITDQWDEAEADERGRHHDGPRPADAHLPDDNPTARAARRAHLDPHDDLVLDSDPRKRSKWWSIRYILRVRTNLVLILASALGYFYFTGLRSFATLYTTRHFGVSTSVATSLVLVAGIGAFAGVLSGGRIADCCATGGSMPAPWCPRCAC